MTTPPTDFVCRSATQDDETNILDVLEEVAPEIPVRLDGAERQDKIKTLIVERRMTGKSFVAIDADGEVVGFLLARPDVIDGQAAIFVDYVGVSATSRQRGVFSAMMEMVKAQGLPIAADVLHGNKSRMADRLRKIGFIAIGTNAKQARFVWKPVS